LSQVQSHLERFGFDDPEALSVRLIEVGLSEADAESSQRLQELVIGPNIEGILERFYDHLWQIPTARHWLESRTRVERLRRTQRMYLLGLGREFWTPDYFEGRLRVGVAHGRIGLPLPLYQASFGLLQRILLEYADSTAGDAVALRRELVNFIVQITALDLSLGIDAFRRREVGHWRQEVEHLREEREHLREEVETDPLTGAASRRAVLGYLEDLLDRDGQGPISVVVADVDHFKDVNDELGHVAGDQVLIEVVKRFGGALRRRDVLGRYGGDELLAVLVDADIEAAAEVAERVRRAVTASPIKLGESEVTVTVTLGVSESTPGDTSMALFGRADEALYEMKRAGRNRIGSARAGSSASD